MSTLSFEQIRGLAADVLDVNGTSLSPASGPDSVESWDSVQHLNLVLAMESEFGVSVPPEDIDKLRTVGDIIDAVERMQNDE